MFEINYKLIHFCFSAAPQFMKRPDDQKIVEGHPVFFSCDINSDPPAKISWKKDGNNYFVGYNNVG